MGSRGHSAVRRLVVAALTTGAALALAAPAAAPAARVRFAKPVFVDRQLAGGEPLVFADRKHHTLIYTSHEGTTHLYRNGIVNPLDFVANYRNQVNIWVSKDDGRTWKRDNFAGTGFQTPPAKNTGFSDPDLTQDAGGRVYNTGIDLANDALFSTDDGGYSWDRGTLQCHDGDRPWLAGGRKNEVFMATDTAEGELSHQIFRSSDGGNTCSNEGVPDAGSATIKKHKLDYAGDGKLYYDGRDGGRLIEPVVFTKPGEGLTENATTYGQGVATWRRGQKKFGKPVLVDKGTMFAHWPAMAIDSAHNVYMVWDTDPRKKGTSGGCSGAETPKPNVVEWSVSRDFGKHWSEPKHVAAPGASRAYWPWLAAGKTGRISIVWYQTDHVVDLDCTPARTYVYEATITGAASKHPKTHVVKALGRPIHDNFVCQGGTTCVATGQDRRLGDFFTNAVDPRGCVLIATGDTTVKGLGGTERPTALPLFLRQNAGPGLRGKGC
jgi:hypothetical protein